MPGPIPLVAGQQQAPACDPAAVETSPLEVSEPGLGDVQAAAAQPGQRIGRAADGGRHDGGGDIRCAPGTVIGNQGDAPASPDEGRRHGAASEAIADDQGGPARPAHAGVSLCP